MRLNEIEKKASTNYVDVKKLNEKTLDALEQCGVIKARLQMKLKSLQENANNRK